MVAPGVFEEGVGPPISRHSFPRPSSRRPFYRHEVVQEVRGSQAEIWNARSLPAALPEMSVVGWGALTRPRVRLTGSLQEKQEPRSWRDCRMASQIGPQLPGDGPSCRGQEEPARSLRFSSLTAGRSYSDGSDRLPRDKERKM